jgi:transcriptional regulator with XRE-family HTH domain
MAGKGKLPPKEKIVSSFSQWLDEQLMHGEATNLAEELGVAVSTVTHWRQGRNTPTANHCGQIANYFKVEPTEVEKMVREARLIRHKRKIMRRRQQTAEADVEAEGAPVSAAEATAA